MIENQKAPLSANRNRHIKEYLSYYLALPHSPHYAVMITGPWGIGKTFLVKKFFQDRGESDETNKCIYVSLFGLTSSEELDTAVFQAAYPALGWKTTKLAGRVGKAALRYLRIDLDVNVQGFSQANCRHIRFRRSGTLRNTDKHSLGVHK
jgi:KAP family P-loop domain